MSYVPAEPLRDLGLKVVLTRMAKKATIGVSAEGCDPLFRPYEEPADTPDALDLNFLIAAVPSVVDAAIMQWARAKQRPVYKLPTPPPAAPRPAPARPVPAVTAAKPKPAEPSMKPMF